MSFTILPPEKKKNRKIQRCPVTCDVIFEHFLLRMRIPRCHNGNYLKLVGLEVRPTIIRS